MANNSINWTGNKVVQTAIDAIPVQLPTQPYSPCPSYGQQRGQMQSQQPEEMQSQQPGQTQGQQGQMQGQMQGQQPGQTQSQQPMPIPGLFPGQMPSQQPTQPRTPGRQQTMPPTLSGPPPVMDIDYIPGYLRSLIGKPVRAEFIIGSSQYTDRNGIMVDVGVNYFVLNDPNSRTNTMCDLYSVKFVTSFNV